MTFEIPSFEDMNLMLYYLFQRRLITKEEALKQSPQREELEDIIQRYARPQ